MRKRYCLLFLFLFLFLSSGYSTVYYWINNTTGLFGNPGNWSFSSGGTAVSTIPGPQDTVIFDGLGGGSCTIGALRSVNRLETNSGFGNRISMLATNTFTFTIGLGGLLHQSGVIDGVPSSASVVVKGKTELKGGTLDLRNATFDGDFVVTSGTIQHNKGMVQITGDMLIGTGAVFNPSGDFVFTGTRFVNNGSMKGNLSSFSFAGNNVFFEGTSNVEFHLARFLLNGYAELRTNLIIDSLMSMNRGKLYLANFDVVLNKDGARIESLVDDSYVVVGGSGQVKVRYKSWANSTVKLPIGDSIFFSPCELLLRSANVGLVAELSIKVINEIHPNAGVNINYLERYFQLSASNITNPLYDFSFKYNATEDPVGDITSMTTQFRSGGVWVDGGAAPVSNITDSTFGWNGANLFGDFTAFKTNIIPEVSFKQSTVSVNEGDGSYDVELMLSEASTTGNINVTYDILGSALDGSDYSVPARVTLFEPGQTDTVITITIFDDGLVEGTEDISIKIKNVTGGGAIIGKDSVITITLIDNDVTAIVGCDGPGGVGDDVTNVLWLDASQIVVADGASVTSWPDISGNSIAAFQSNIQKGGVFRKAEGDHNNQAAIKFDGIDDILFLPDHQRINSVGPYTARKLLIAFRTGNDVTRRQVIYSEGGNQKGFTIYIDNGNIYFAAVNSTNEDPTTPWGAIELHTALGANESHIGTCVFDQSAGIIKMYLDGAFVGSTSGTGNLFAHTESSTCIGASAGNNHFHDGPYNGGEAHYFEGHIAEIIMYDFVLNGVQGVIIENYLSSKYDIPISEDHYGFDAVFFNEVIGIGQISPVAIHSSAKGRNIFKITSPTDLNLGEYLFVGHNNLAIDSWSIKNNNLGTSRIPRVWRVSEQQGDVGEVKIVLDVSKLPSIPSDSLLVVMVNPGGVFDDGNTIIAEMTKGAGGEYEITGNIQNGDFITFGLIQPKVGFASTINGDFESETQGVLGVQTNYIVANDVKVSLAYNSTKSSALVSNDFTLPSLMEVTIPARGDTAYFFFTVINDLDIEKQENITFELSTASSGISFAEDSVMQYLIFDDDDSIKVGLSEKLIMVNEDIGDIKLIVQTTRVVGGPVVNVDYVIINGSPDNTDEAMVGLDFNTTSGVFGTLSIPSSSQSVEFDITIVDDLIKEATEDFTLFLQNPSPANLDTTENYFWYSTVRIIDNDTGVAPFTIDASTVKNVSCNGGSDGEAEVITTGVNTLSYSWSSGETTAKISGKPAGEYVVQVRDNVSGVTLSDSVIISEPSKIIKTGETVVSASCGEKNGSAKILVSGGTPPYNYVWVSPIQITQQAINLSSGAHIVNVRDNNSCTQAFFVNVPEDTACNLKIYSGFTPNADGYNDTWIIDGITSYTNVRVTIYNRWGAIVWSRNGYDNNTNVWDGTSNNNTDVLVPVGTYYYIVEADDEKYKGWVELSW